MRDAVLASGGRAALVGGAMCLADERTPAVEVNRAVPVGPHVDVAAIASWYAGHDHVVAAPPGYLGLEESLRAHGYTPGYAWMKFTRNDAPAAPPPTDLRVAESLDAEAYALAAAEGFGLPPALARGLASIVGAPGWLCFVAWDGDEPAASAAVYAEATEAWFGLGATRPAFRRRGAQTALLAARIERVRELGVRRLSTETGERIPERPDQSYRNILRAGFRETYLRPNWRSPRPKG